MVLAALLRSYDTVLLPFGGNARYDFVVATAAGEFRRVQCKTGRIKNGTVFFKTVSLMYHHRGGGGQKARKYLGEIDDFGVYCPDNGKSYLVPIEDVGENGQAGLRVEAPKNNQAIGVRWAEQYEMA